MRWDLPSEFHVGELDTLAQLVKATLLTSEESARRDASTRWPALLLENRVEGISVNTQTERRVDSVLASLIAALVAYGGHSTRETGDKPIQSPEIDDLVAALSLLARLTPPLGIGTRDFAGGSGPSDPRGYGRSEPRHGAAAAELRFAVRAA